MHIKESWESPKTFYTPYRLYSITLGPRVLSAKFEKKICRKQRIVGKLKFSEAKQYPTRMVNFMKAFFKRSQTFAAFLAAKSRS